MMKAVSRAQALACTEKREFESDILGAGQCVVVILTQSWCPQWQAMKPYLEKITGPAIYFLEYDLTDYSDRFRRFKETVFGNDQIPYIRYYRDGQLVGVSNAVSEDEFLKNCAA
jgi:hypothetical protein